MATAELNPPRKLKAVSILRHYVTSTDAKNRISLRGSKAKYFDVKALSNGSYLLEPRVLVPPEAIPARTLKMLESSVVQLKRGQASPPIDLARFLSAE